MHGPIRRIVTLCVVLAALSVAAQSDDVGPKQQSEPSPAETPLGRFFDRLFEGVTDPPEKKVAPAVEAVGEAQRITPDAIDERAAAGRRQHRDLIRAQRLLQAGEQSVGLSMLQQLLDADEDTLILSNDGRWESLQRTTERLIGSGGDRLRKAYVERFGTLADERLRQAKNSGQPADYADVARRFLITPAGQEAVRILAGLSRDGGEPVEASYWEQRLTFETGREPPSLRASVGRPQPPVDPSQPLPYHGTDWPQPFGGPTHRGAFPPTEPVLIERWAVPIAVRVSVAEQVGRLVRDLVDNHRACVPTAMPLAVDGKIISRTLRGLSVLEADTGRLLWESAEGVSIERLLQGNAVPQPGSEPSARRTRAIPPYRGTNADGHPLAGLLFRDGVYGLLSSDGEQVFVLEDHASLSHRQPGYFWGQRVKDDPFDRDWSTNRLVAYNLQTGRVRWRIGGRRLDEPFDPPLAGTLFLGPPVVDGDELFVIGERHGTMFLFVLDRQTGRLNWEHAISEVGAEIQQDLVRRWWPAQPSVGTGVIVCPTTAGWMVAIDRLQRRIRWTYRYIETRQKKVSSNRSRVAATGPLNTRWCPSAPVMTQRYVVFTPSELPDPLYGDHPVAVCLDLLTGERLWRVEKDARLYLGSVADGRVLLVGKETIEARELSTGKRLWKTPLNLQAAGVQGKAAADTRSLLGDAGPPSGRGIIVGEDYLLPLQSGQLWTIDMATGVVRRTLALRDDDRPLGNLLIHQGRLVSVGPFAVRCFEKRSAITSELAEAGGSATPARSRLRAAELRFIEGDFAEARKVLQSLPTADVPPALRRQADELLWETLIQLVRLDPTSADAEFDELADLAKTDEQQLTVERMQADRLLARGDRQAAFDVYWQHAENPQSVRVSEGETSLRFDRWLAGRLKRLRETGTPQEQEQMDERIRATVLSVLGSDDESLAWWAEVLRFHPSGDELRRALAERALDNKRWTAAETHLLQLIEATGDDELQSWAFDRLLSLTLDRDRPQDAGAYVGQYAASIGDADSIMRKYADRLPDDSHSPVARWSEGTWALSRSPASFNRTMFEPVLAIQPGLPSVDRLKLRVEPTLHRLSIGPVGGGSNWETPLQAQLQSLYNHTTGAASVGQLLFVVHRGVLHAISAAENELLWRQKFDVQSASAGYVRGPSFVRQQELRDSKRFLWSEGLRQTRTPMGMLAVWRPGYVAYFGARTITLADPLTGDAFWTREGIPSRTMAYGTADTLFIVPPSPHAPYAVSVLNGSPVPMPHLATLIPSAVSVTDGGLVVVSQHQPFRLFGWGRQTVRVRLVDPHTGKAAWSLDVPAATRFACIGENEIIAVAPDGHVQTIDCRTGQSRALGQVGTEAMDHVQRLYAIAERGRVYIAFNQPPKPGTYSRSYQSVPVHGTLAAFDRKKGRLLWKQEVESQNLIVDQLPHLPVLVLTSQRPQRDGDVTSQQVFVEVRDKETGELLLDDSRYITGGSLREMEVDHSRRQIDLKTYNDRLRLLERPTSNIEH